MFIQKRKMMILVIAFSVVVLIAIAGRVFISLPPFGRLPQGERLERIQRSPNYRNGEFRNQQPTPMLTSGRSRLATMLGFLFRKQDELRPQHPIPALKTNLHQLPADRDLVVWFGHSSYLLQVEGKRILVDPVFCSAAPAGFLNKPFQGTNIYVPSDMPPIDYLIITHDHWDHLDHKTVTQLRDRIGRVVCPLGVGEHFERWGFRKEQISELDWNEQISPDTGFRIHCLPARHFSGRGLKSNQTLWASFLLESPSKKIYMAGDGGYGSHFAHIGRRFPNIDLAILENGQYNTDWRYIHILPEQLSEAAIALGAQRILTVHHSKYALARHPWYEPLRNEERMLCDEKFNLLVPQIGEATAL